MTSDSDDGTPSDESHHGGDTYGIELPELDFDEAGWIDGNGCILPDEW